MTLHLPWLELTVLFPLIGALGVLRSRNADVAARHTVILSALTLACAVGAWLDFDTLHSVDAHDRWDFLTHWLGPEALVIDGLSAPLIPLTALVYLVSGMITLRSRARGMSHSWVLLSEAILLATLSCRHHWGLVLLLALGTIPPLVDLKIRKRPTRVYVLHLGLFIVLLAAGQGLLMLDGPGSSHSIVGVCLMIAAVLLRSGIVPVHCWMTDLFEHATFSTAILFVTPTVGAYAAVRLVLPIAPAWALHGFGVISLITAVYAAGMALVQHEARRFFCYLFLSHSSLVLVGLEMVNPIGLTGALSVWLSVVLAQAGFGLTLLAIESRTGRLSLDSFHGLYDHTPTLAVFFLLTGLASIGFPGTFGFIGTELLVNGAVEVYPLIGIAVVIAAALNGIAVLQAYFRLFTGARHTSAISLARRRREQLAVLTLAFLILGGGLYPQPGISSRYHAAMQIVDSRHILPDEPESNSSAAGKLNLGNPPLMFLR